MNEKYLIPKRLAKKNTMFEGIGLTEMGIVLGFVVVGIVILLPLKALFNIWVGLVGFLVPTLIGVVLVVPLSYQENLLIKGKRIIEYQKQQKRFYYYRGTR